MSPSLSLLFLFAVLFLQKKQRRTKRADHLKDLAAKYGNAGSSVDPMSTMLDNCQAELAESDKLRCVAPKRTSLPLVFGWPARPVPTAAFERHLCCCACVC